ncbi:flippase-like domain-containing protein [Candidatus Saccharibacteria bacterium]|nr:flippase-like domain-containing protein [Candidatus Saccharibacteria bacterium]
MSDKQKNQRWKVILTWVTLIALIALAYTLRHQLAETFSNLGRVNALVLLLIIPIQLWNHHAQTKMYQTTFWLLGDRLRYRSMYRLSLEMNFVNNIFPSASVSGFSYFGYRLKSGAGISGTKSTLVQLMKFILMFVSFQIFLVFGVMLLALDGQANGFIILTASSLMTLLVVTTVGLAFVIGSKRRINGFFTTISRWLNKIIHKIRRNNPETIKIDRVKEIFTDLHDNYMQLRSKPRSMLKPLWYSLIANGTEIATVYVVYIAFGAWVNPGAIILAYAIANFAGFVSVLPGGVGIYEGLMTIVLAAAGVPPAISLPVTVMYRVINMLIQLPPGGWLYYRSLHSKPLRHG